MTFGLVSTEKRIKHYRIYYNTSESDVSNRFVRKSAYSINNLRATIISDVLKKDYERSVNVFTEDGGFVGRLRYNKAKKRYEWTANRTWTKVHVLNTDGTFRS